MPRRNGRLEEFMPGATAQLFKQQPGHSANYGGSYWWIPCPECGAGEGQGCHRLRGAHPGQVHKSRRRAAVRRAAELA